MQNKRAYNPDVGNEAIDFFKDDELVKDDTPMNSIHEQLKLDTPLLPIIGNSDYDRYHAELNLMDDLCRRSGIDDEVVGFMVDRAQCRSDAARASRGLPRKALTARVKVRLRQKSQMFFRAALLRKYTTESLRVFCRGVAESPLRQKFCRINRFVEAKIFSKSALGDFENDLPADFLKRVHAKLLLSARGKLDPKAEVNQLGLRAPVSMEHCYADTTCVQANIHYPVDWLLLRDATRTLMLACRLIRDSGLRHRMPCEPNEFISKINALCIQMTQCRRKKDSRKRRKAVLRLMKKLLKKVAATAGASRSEHKSVSIIPCSIWLCMVLSALMDRQRRAAITI